MTRLILAVVLAALLSGCAGEAALIRCALAQHDINRRCQ